MALRREFLMLAHTFNPKKHGVGGWFLSEKLDGQRAFWDGGISRGIPKAEVPWANTAKDARYVNKQIATGLWSRYGNVIHAPDWWLDGLPAVMLDGELWNGDRSDGGRQDLMSTIKKLVPGDGWRDVDYHVFDMPPPGMVFMTGKIKSPNFTKDIKNIADWEHGGRLAYEPHDTVPFERVVTLMDVHLGGSDHVRRHPQVRLPFGTDAALKRIDDCLADVCSIGGEGLMLRKPESWWVPKRMWEVLKVKKFDDDEGIVTGYITGRQTDKGSKLLGLMGALVLDYNGKRLELSGFTDEERSLESLDPQRESASLWAALNPGMEVPSWISATYFPRGSVVTFRHRGKTRDGIPCEARYWRARSI